MIVPHAVLKVGLNKIPDNVGYDEASAAEPSPARSTRQMASGGRLHRRLQAGPIGCMHPDRPRGRSARWRWSTSTPSACRCPRTRSSRTTSSTRPRRTSSRRSSNHRRAWGRCHHHGHPGQGHRSRPSRWRPSFGGLPKNDPVIACDSNLVHYRQLHIHGANGSRRGTTRLRCGTSRPVGAGQDLITQHIPLSDVLDAFGIVQRGERSRSPWSRNRLLP